MAKAKFKVGEEVIYVRPRSGGDEHETVESVVKISAMGRVTLGNNRKFADSGWEIGYGSRFLVPHIKKAMAEEIAAVNKKNRRLRHLRVLTRYPYDTLSDDALGALVRLLPPLPPKE